jgi:AraC-like DNA-binding protein
MVGHLMQTSATVKEAFDNLSRYTEVVTNMFHYHTALTGNSFEIFLNPSAHWQQYFPDTAQQAADQAMAGCLNVCRLLTGRALVPNEAWLVRQKPNHTAGYERILKAPLVFEMQANKLVFDASVAQLPVLGFNKDLQAIFRQMSDEVLQKTSTTGTFAQLVKQAVVNHFTCIPTLMQVASYFAVTERTLQRRLEKEDTSFHKIIEEIRKDLAMKLLKTNKYSIGEAAYMLGYAEPAVFRRAFKRWTGKTPKQVVKLR